MERYANQLNRITVIALALIGASMASAQLPTLAWTETLGDNAMPRGMTPLVVDRYGYAIYNYQTTSLHLRRVSPAANPMFDVSVLTLPRQFTMGGMFISPLVGGKQFVYLVWEAPGADQAFDVFVAKYDTDGQAQWQTPEDFSATNGNAFFVNGAADASGNCYLALSDANGDATRLRLLKLGSDGSTASDLTIDELNPTVGWGNFSVITTNWQWNPLRPFVCRHEGFYDSYSSTWFMAGSDNLAAGNARWGAYDATTGTRKFGGTFAATDVDSPEAHVFPLPNLRFAVVENRVRDNTLFFSTLNKFNLTEYYFSGLKLWRYPASGNDTYNVHQVVAYGKDDSIYIAGSNTDGGYYGIAPTVNLFEQLSPNGALLSRSTSGHAFDIIPAANGFFAYTGATSPSFVHASPAGIVDYSYGMDTSQYENAVAFRNHIYMLQHIHTPIMGTRLAHWVTGITLSGLTFPTTIAAHQAANLHLTLNAPAPAGGIQVGLNSSSPALLFASGNVQNIFVTIPSGQQALDVPMNAQTVAANTNVALLAIQAGVRRSITTIVTP